MSDSRTLRAQLEATQKRLEEVERGGDDEAMLRAAMELNEKQQRLTAARAERKENEAALTTALQRFRGQQAWDQEMTAQTQRSPYETITQRFLAKMGIGVAFIVLTVPGLSSPMLPMMVGVGIGGAVVAAAWGYHSRRTNAAVERASRLL